MVCKLVIRPKTKDKALFLSRKKQGQLLFELTQQLGYAPFIFNTVIGVFIFAKKRTAVTGLLHWVKDFLERESFKNFEMEDCTENPRFFRNFTKDLLGNKKASALAWKRYINSFLLQINPFNPQKNEGIKVFKRMEKTIKKNGTTAQRKHFKQRLKILRNRVSLSSIEAVLKRDS